MRSEVLASALRFSASKARNAASAEERVPRSRTTTYPDPRENHGKSLNKVDLSIKSCLAGGHSQGFARFWHRHKSTASTLAYASTPRFLFLGESLRLILSPVLLAFHVPNTMQETINKHMNTIDHSQKYQSDSEITKRASGAPTSGSVDPKYVQLADSSFSNKWFFSSTI